VSAPSRRGPAARAGAVLRTALGDVAEHDRGEIGPARRRRRAVVAATLVVGAVLLGVSLSVEPGDSLFYYLTFALAAVWLAGGVLSGPLHLGRLLFRGRLRRPIVTPIALGIAAAAVFVAGALVTREIPAIADIVRDVLDHARQGSLPLLAVITVVNGIAEEVFFRGALFAAIDRRRAVLASTLVYGLATVATANPMLVFAALLLGFVLGLERRITGGVLAPILTHITWSSAMLFVLPPLFGSG
jgi:membrane protease YdiL (CAAX protease family)